MISLKLAWVSCFLLGLELSVSQAFLSDRPLSSWIQVPPSSSDTHAASARLSQSQLQLGVDSGTTLDTSFVLQKSTTATPSRWSRITRRQREPETTEQQLVFRYDYDQLELSGSKNAKTTPPAANTTGVLLIHPIGVGIGKWFYNRLIRQLQARYDQKSSHSYIVVVPDLVGSGSACNPTWNGNEMIKLPLFNVSDWSDQMVHIMTEVQTTKPEIQSWCLVANGGCAPIALQVAKRSVENTSTDAVNVSQVIISSAPRLPFFLQSSDPAKVAKSYRTLCGILGKLFWWYACRNKGKFIQKFSEKNLVADPDNLGDSWTPNCVQTARLSKGKSRYSTFSFLAGALQDGCQVSLKALKDTNVRIDIIMGRDMRRNKAKSWFWQKRKPKGNNKESTTKESNKTEGEMQVVEEPRKTFRDFVEENGNGGRERMVGGRISLAHEDAPGYADALVALIME
jgi:hypothetical protein